MLQSASSLLPVLALNPQMNEKVLDLAAAPGGKTSYIAQLMRNTGTIFANDLKKERLKALEFNLFRMGVTNVVVTCRDGRKYQQIFPNAFDKVLIDAPCTGLGIISKDPSIKAKRVLLDIYKNSHVQKELLLSAIDCAKSGGVIVYSTCSVSPLENEEVINYALSKRHVKIADMDDLVEVGEQGVLKFVDKRYHVDLRKTKRVYPHVHNMDGFYLAKLVKTAIGKKEISKEDNRKHQ
jgi:ribosomal RNA methyltransferase Nop2